MRQRIHDTLFRFFILVIALLIPVISDGGIEPKILSWVIGFFFLNWLISLDYIRTIPRLLREPWRYRVLMLSVIYYIYLAGCIYSGNPAETERSMEVKLSLALFPLIFATSRQAISPSMISRSIKAYVAGCLGITLFLTGHACYVFAAEQQPGTFYYLKLAWFTHPSYLSMFLIFAMSAIALHQAKSWNQQTWLSRLSFILLQVWFLLFIILLSSKGGILVMMLTTILFAGYLTGYRKQWKPAALVLILFTGLVYLFLVLFPYALERSHQANQVVEQQQHSIAGRGGDSTYDRIEIWRISFRILEKNWLAGMGTGDVKEALLEQYRLTGAQHALEFQLNAHNQYLQTFLSIGIAGLVVLVLMLILPAITALRKHDFHYFAFLIIFSVSILVESMLEVQAGAIWFGFFNTLLFAGLANQPNKKAGTRPAF